MLGVRDDQKATAKLDELFARVSERLTSQQGGIEDAKSRVRRVSS